MSGRVGRTADRKSEGPEKPPEDINFRAILLGGAILVALMVMAVVGSRFFGDFLDAERKEAVRGPEPLPGTPQVRPEPHLQRAAAEDLARLRREEEAVLKTFHLDKQTGVIRIPVERAMEILAREGLPARTEPPEGAGEGKQR